MFGLDFGGEKQKRLRRENEQLRELIEDLENTLDFSQRRREQLHRDLVSVRYKLKTAEQTITKLNSEIKSKPTGIQIDPDDLRTLISLCHPDKHNQRESAKVITQKLLGMRGRR